MVCGIGCVCSETAQQDAARQKLELELGELKKEKVPYLQHVIMMIVQISLTKQHILTCHKVLFLVTFASELIAKRQSELSLQV